MAHGLENEKGAVTESWKKSIRGERTARAKAPRHGQACCVLVKGHSFTCWIQICCPRDSDGAPSPGWLLEPLPAGHQRAAVLLPSRLTAVCTLQGHSKSGCFLCAASRSLFMGSGHGQHFEICEAGQCQFLKLSEKWAKIATSVIQTRIHIGEKYVNEGPGELMASLSLPTREPQSFSSGYRPHR